MKTHVLEADPCAITDRQQTSWASGDFSQIARQLVRVSEDLCSAMDPHPADRVLDVACGSGNTCLIAARRFCEVTGIDFVPAQIECARRRAEAEHFQIDFQVQDAQALSFSNGSFDHVLSVFGVMFAPDQEKAAAEMLRVCRPGGKIGLANWMPEAFGGDFYKVHVKYMPPPAGLMPGGRWGTRAGLMNLFGSGIQSMTTSRLSFHMYFRTIEHMVEAFLTNFGPTSRAFAYVDEPDRERFRRDLRQMFERYNEATDGTAIVKCEYVQMVGIRS